MPHGCPASAGIDYHPPWQECDLGHGRAWPSRSSHSRVDPLCRTFPEASPVMATCNHLPGQVTGPPHVSVTHRGLCQKEMRRLGIEEEPSTKHHGGGGRRLRQLTACLSQEGSLGGLGSEEPLPLLRRPKKSLVTQDVRAPAPCRVVFLSVKGLFLNVDIF